MNESYHYTAAELIAYLSKLPSKTKIILSVDEEGNAYHDMIFCEVYAKNLTPKKTQTITHCILFPIGPGHDTLEDL